MVGRQSASACHLAMSPKAVPEGHWRYRGQNQRPSSWGHSLALLVRVGRASTNTLAGSFQVGCSRCGQRQARLRKICYHSCDTDSNTCLIYWHIIRIYCVVLCIWYVLNTYQYVFNTNINVFDTFNNINVFETFQSVLACIVLVMIKKNFSTKIHFFSTSI